MNPKQIILALAAAIALASPALAQSQSPIRVEGAWARSTPPGAKTAAAYMTVVNTGHDPDRLVAVSTPVAGEADIHRTVDEKGVMKMRPAGPVDVEPGSPVVLGPAGLHVMMMDLKQPLADGQEFPVTLVFEKAGKVQVSVHVQRTAPGHGHGDADHSMGGMSMPGMPGMHGH